MILSFQLLALVIKYGYAAAFVGVVLEGETVLALSGIAVHRGLLEAHVLLGIGTAAAMLTDNFFFGIGRGFGRGLVIRFPRLAPSVARVDEMLVRFPRIAVVVMRFLYGTRTVGPALLGTGSIAWLRFFVLDALAAGAWCACWLSAGYILGEVAEQLIQGFVGVGRWVMLGAAGIAVAIALLLARSRR